MSVFYRIESPGYAVESANLDFLKSCMTDIPTKRSTNYSRTHCYQTTAIRLAKGNTFRNTSTAYLKISIHSFRLPFRMFSQSGEIKFTFVRKWIFSYSDTAIMMTWWLDIYDIRAAECRGTITPQMIYNLCRCRVNECNVLCLQI